MSTEPIQNNFSSVLVSLERGQLHHDATLALRDLVATLSEAGATRGKAKGKLVITLDLDLKDDVISIVGKLEAKGPKLSRPQSVFWATPENNLTLRNPKQQEMGLVRDASTDQREVRSAN